MIKKISSEKPQNFSIRDVLADGFSDHLHSLDVGFWENFKTFYIEEIKKFENQDKTSKNFQQDLRGRRDEAEPNDSGFHFDSEEIDSMIN